MTLTIPAAETTKSDTLDLPSARRAVLHVLVTTAATTAAIALTDTAGNTLKTGLPSSVESLSWTGLAANSSLVIEFLVPPGGAKIKITGAAGDAATVLGAAIVQPEAMP